MECTHLLDNVKVDPNVEDSSITKNFNCSECSVSDQNWLCLHCGAVNCGRYINGHAKQHADTLDHQLCMSCDVYSVYCYKCDDYVSNDLEKHTIHKIRQSIMQIVRQKEGNSNIDQVEDSKDGITSIVFNSSAAEEPTSSSGEESRTDETPTSSCDLPTTITNTNTDTSANKSSKSIKNSEEPVRSLRPRSRKRTLTDDSNFTENSETFRSKEKKTICNGKSPREKKIVGLKNLGNTCFMNVVLQSLNNIQEFSCYFSQLPSLEVKTNGRRVYHSRSYTRQEMHDVIMAEELRKVLINLNSGCGSKGAISPECLFLVIWKVVPRFRGYQQQDAHEFLRYMLDRLHTELQQLRPERSSPGPPPSSIVTTVFGGTLQSEVRCLSCDARSTKLDPFLDLSLELPEARHDAPAALHDCLASFVQVMLLTCCRRVWNRCASSMRDQGPLLLAHHVHHLLLLHGALATLLIEGTQQYVEELADTERYFCSSCKCKQKSTKQFWIRRLPNVLCLHLKRFRWHNYFRTKVDTRIEFPLRALDLSRFVLPDVRPRLYDLAAVIVHHGSGAGSGHYTAFANNEEQWLHFNDQSVRAADEAAVAGCKPYILFYIRRERPELPS